MKKNGFTLIEVIAVIVILCVVVSITTINVLKIKKDSDKKLLETKIKNLESAAIIYVQEHPEIVIFGDCDLKSLGIEVIAKSCTIVSVKDLISQNYFKTTEKDEDGDIDLINNVTHESMWEEGIWIYKMNNNYYAKLLVNPYVSGYTYAKITRMKIKEGNTFAKVKLSVIKGDNEISDYYYSKDGGRTYEKNNGPTYTFTNLSPGQSYTIQAYAIDSEGKRSNIVREEINLPNE